MHTASRELCAVLSTEEGQIFIERHSVEQHQPRVCPWHHWNDRLARQCRFYVQVKLQLAKKSMYLQYIICGLCLSFILFCLFEAMSSDGCEWATLPTEMLAVSFYMRLC